MAKRARTVHIFDGWADLPGKGFEVVATNDRWTTLSPDRAEKWDSLPLSKDTKMPVLDMWFDDKEGIVARVHQAGLVAGVFTLPDELPGAHSAADLADCLLILEVLDKKQAKELKKAAMGTPASFAKWTFAHGLEKLLGLPAVKAAKPKKKAAAPAKKKAAAKPAKKVAKAPAKKKAAAKPKKAAKAPPRKVR